jgi:dipeptidyl aminopeptidase/acylaminoacyl peptidase
LCGVSVVRLLVGLASIGVSVGTARAQSITPWTPELSMAVKRVSSVTPSPDGAKVAFVVAEAVMEGEQSEWLSHVHLANADGSESRQLTRGEKSSTNPRWSPDGKWIGFVSSRSGSANVWRISLAGGEAEQITDEKGGITSFDWSPDGASIAFIMPDPKTDKEEQAAKEKRDWRTIDQDVKMKRLYVQAVERDARPPRKLTTASYSVEDFDWSHDGRTIAFQHQPTPSPSDWTRSDISIVAVNDETVRALVNSPAAEQHPRFSPDGTRIAFVGSEAPPMWASTGTVHVVANHGGPSQRLATTPDSQAELVDWTADGTRVLVSETDRTVPTLYAVPVDGKAPTVVGLAKMNVGSAMLNASATHLGFVSQDFDKPPEAFISKLDGTFVALQVSHAHLSALLESSAQIFSVRSSLEAQASEVQARPLNRSPIAFSFSAVFVSSAGAR